MNVLDSKAAAQIF